MTAHAYGTPGDAHEVEDLLRRRAVQLARPVSTPAAGGMQVLEVGIGEQCCLIEMKYLHEVRLLRDLMPIPLAAEPLIGLVHFRGRMIPVFDLRDLLYLSREDRARPQRLLIVGRDAPDFGVAVAQVHGIQRLALEEAERRSEPLQNMRPEIVRGVTREGQLLLDGDHLLALHRSVDA